MTTQVRKPITRPFARINGLPVAVAIVDPYLAMAAAFAAAFPGISLVIYSAIRLYEDQVRIFKQRYVTADQINGRRVYDVRRWNGVLWYRISAVGTVAAPGTSNHETGRSLDLRDTGSDAGVAASFTNARNRWLSQNCHRWGFTHTGRNFAEPWHFEQLQVADPWGGLGKPLNIVTSDPGQALTTSTGNGSITPTASEEDDMTPEQAKMLQELHDAVFKDGKKQTDWSLSHKIDHTNRMVSTQVVGSPGGPQGKWTMPHALSWLMRQVTEILKRLPDDGKK